MTFEKLAEPFPEDDLEWRVSRSGFKGEKPWLIVLPYVTNRAIQQRLDEVVSPPCWRNEYVVIDGGFLCGLSVLHDGEWVTKWDGAEQTEIESVKGGLSNAMKRAAVQWGIGRYLYHYTDPFFAIVQQGGSHTDKVTDKKSNNFEWVSWNPPSLTGQKRTERPQTGPSRDSTPQPSESTPPGDAVALVSKIREIQNDKRTNAQDTIQIQKDLTSAGTDVERLRVVLEKWQDASVPL